MNADDPALYLTQDPTPEERALGQMLGLHDGASVPMWMLAKVAVRQRDNAFWIRSMEGLLRRARRLAIACLSAAALNLSAIGIYAAHRLEASGAAQERDAYQERMLHEYRDAAEREIQDLRLDIRELRAELRRMSGADVSHPGADLFQLPDKVSHLLLPKDSEHDNASISHSTP